MAPRTMRPAQMSRPHVDRVIASGRSRSPRCCEARSRSRPAPFPAMTRGRRELTLFLSAYVLYDAAHWAYRGDVASARDHAHAIDGLERAAHVAIEPSVQHAFNAGIWIWLLSNIYLAAQLAVLPGALVWLYRRDFGVYRALRSTVLGTWLMAVPIFAEEGVLDEASILIPGDEDEEVEKFREFLDNVSPEDFAS
jgi:hypothetical protein